MCLSTEKPRKCLCAARMSTNDVEDADASVSDSRTSDENRCDSTALLERELKLTAEKCSTMAEKLTKSACIQKHRKQQHASSCEHQTGTEELEKLIAILKYKVTALQMENKMLQKPKQNYGALCEQQTENETQELQVLVKHLECKVLSLQNENIKLHKLKKGHEQNGGALCDQQNEISENHSSSTELKHKVSALWAENLKLRQLLKDVTEVNKRWQKYNRETQAYIQRLEESIQNQNPKELDSTLLSLHDEASSTDIRNARLFPACRHSDSQLEQSTGQTALRLRYENAVKEVCKLRKQLVESQQIQGALMQQIKLLRTEKTDQLMLHEFQTNTYKEDWEAEKKEKIIAQEKVSQLTEKITELQTELNDCKKRLKHIQATSSGSNPSEGLWNWNKVKPTAPFHSRLTGIKSWANALTERGPYPVNIVVADTTDETQKSQSAPTSWENVKVDDLADSSLIDDDKNALECPGCKKTFPRNLHLQFLDHFEECQTPNVES